jgi:hypothetical protein
MIRTVWKPTHEIEHSLRGKDRVAVLSCGWCANLSGTGGTPGLAAARALLEGMGKEVVLSELVLACCSEELMAQTVRRYRRRIGDSDAILVLSCAGGVKAACLCEPGVPVLGALDPVGSAVVTRRDDPVANSICKVCGSCVVGHTGGICPVTACPIESRYEPCAAAPTEAGPCALDPRRLCVWPDIAGRADLDALRALAEVHAVQDAPRLRPAERRASPRFMRRLSNWMVARVPGFDKLLRCMN